MGNYYFLFCYVNPPVDIYGIISVFTGKGFYKIFLLSFFGNAFFGC